MPKSNRGRILFAAKLGFSALLLWLVVSRVDFQGIVLRLRSADWRWLALAIGCGPAVVAVSARRWQVLSQGLLRFGPAFRYTCIGSFFGGVMPGAVSGDLAKGLALAAKSSRARDERLPVSILFDKLIGLWVLLVQFCVVALVLLATHPQLVAGLHRLIACGFLGALAGLAAGTGILHSLGIRAARHLAARLPFARVRSVADRTLSAIERYAVQPRLIVRALLLSCAVHGINCVAYWLVLHSLAIPASPLFTAVIYPMLSLLVAMPISISGIGVRDIFILTVFRTFGLNPEPAVAFSWLLLGVGLPMIGVGALIQLWEVFHRQRN